ncbi:MAG: hypothetical protein RJB68_2207, partial [Pseudomonadota bacterium]
RGLCRAGVGFNEDAWCDCVDDVDLLFAWN